MTRSAIRDFRPQRKRVISREIINIQLFDKKCICNKCKAVFENRDCNTMTLCPKCSILAILENCKCEVGYSMQICQGCIMLLAQLEELTDD